MSIWIVRYVGYPDKLALKQGQQFKSKEWESLMKDAGIEVHPSGVESHNELGTREQYHAFIRRVYNKVLTDSVDISEDRALSLPVKACNDTAGENGLVSTVLVFGVVPRMPPRPHVLPKNVSGLNTMIKARKGSSKTIAQSRMATALQRSVPVAAVAVTIGDAVLMFREKPVGKWIGPYIVVKTNGKLLTLNTVYRTLKASVEKIKLYEEKNAPCAENAGSKS